MPQVDATAAPFKLDRPSIVFATLATDPVQVQCASQALDIAGQQEFEDIESFCNHLGEAPGGVRRAINLTVNQSFGDPAGGSPGFWNLMYPYSGQVVDFAILLTGAAACSFANPEISGQCWVPDIPFVQSATAKYSRFTLEFKIFGTPTFATTAGGVAYAGHS